MLRRRGTSTTSVPGRQSGRRSTISPFGSMSAAMPGKSSSTVEPAWVAIADPHAEPLRLVLRIGEPGGAPPVEAGAPGRLVGAALVEPRRRARSSTSRSPAATLASHVKSTWLSAQITMPERHAGARAKRSVRVRVAKPSSPSRAAACAARRRPRRPAGAAARCRGRRRSARRCRRPPPRRARRRPPPGAARRRRGPTPTACSGCRIWSTEPVRLISGNTASVAARVRRLVRPPRGAAPGSRRRHPSHR